MAALFTQKHLHNSIKQITFAAVFVKQQQRIWQLP
jgi:hypothetical protein